MKLNNTLGPVLILLLSTLSISLQNSQADLSYDFNQSYVDMSSLTSMSFTLADELQDVIGKGPQMISQIKAYQSQYSQRLIKLGYALVQIDQYPYQEQMDIIGVLQSINLLIDQQFSEMTYISSIMHAYQNDTCNQRYLISTSKIFDGFKLLLANVIQDQLNYNETSYQEFLQFCVDDMCAESLRRMMYSLIGETPSDCLILDVIKYGSVKNGFQAGISDVFAYQGSYLLQVLNIAVIVESAFRGYIDGSASVTTLDKIYGPYVKDAYDTVVDTYEDILDNYFENGKINLIQQTKNLLDSGLNNEDLIKGADEYIQTYVNYYNPQITWEAYLVKGPILYNKCLNCFVYEDPNSDQKLVYLSVNNTYQPVSLLSMSKNITDASKNFTSPENFTIFLIQNRSLCITGITYLQSNPRLYDYTSYSYYTQFSATNFNILIWQQKDVGCLTVNDVKSSAQSQQFKLQTAIRDQQEKMANII